MNDSAASPVEAWILLDAGVVDVLLYVIDSLAAVTLVVDTTVFPVTALVAVRESAVAFPVTVIAPAVVTVTRSLVPSTGAPTALYDNLNLSESELSIPIAYEFPPVKINASAASPVEAWILSEAGAVEAVEYVIDSDAPVMLVVATNEFAEKAPSEVTDAAVTPPVITASPAVETVTKSLVPKTGAPAAL